MKRLPWHVAFVPDRRAILTACGIALGVAFAVLSFSIVGALGQSTVELGEHLREGDVALARPGMAPFLPADLALEAPTLHVLVAQARTAEGENLTVVAFEGANASAVEPGTYRPVAGYDRALGTLELGGRALAKANATRDDGLASRTWPRVDATDVRALIPAFSDGRITYALAKGLSDEDAARLSDAGFEIHPAPAVDPFFGASAREVARALWIVVAVASILAALFAYEFFRSELRLKRREIALWRAVGMRGRDVRALLLVRAAALGALGVAIGMLAAYALLAAAALATQADLFARQLGPLAALALAACFVAAAVAGSLPPTLRASRETLAHGLEAPA